MAIHFRTWRCSRTSRGARRPSLFSKRLLRQRSVLTLKVTASKFDNEVFFLQRLPWTSTAASRSQTLSSRTRGPRWSPTWPITWRRIPGRGQTRSSSLSKDRSQCSRQKYSDFWGCLRDGVISCRKHVSILSVLVYYLVRRTKCRTPGLAEPHIHYRQLIGDNAHARPASNRTRIFYNLRQKKCLCPVHFMILYIQYE